MGDVAFTSRRKKENDSAPFTTEMMVELGPGAVTEVALFPGRFEAAGADPDAMKEVTEAAVEFMDELEKGRVQVPERIREELRMAIDSL